MKGEEGGDYVNASYVDVSPIARYVDESPIARYVDVSLAALSLASTLAAIRFSYFYDGVQRQ